jgi:hypothetical protein
LQKIFTLKLPDTNCLDQILSWNFDGFRTGDPLNAIITQPIIQSLSDRRSHAGSFRRLAYQTSEIRPTDAAKCCAFRQQYLAFLIRGGLFSLSRLLISRIYIIIFSFSGFGDSGT